MTDREGEGDIGIQEKSLSTCVFNKKKLHAQLLNHSFLHYLSFFYTK